MFPANFIILLPIIAVIGTQQITTQPLTLCPHPAGQERE